MEGFFPLIWLFTRFVFQLCLPSQLPELNMKLTGEFSFSRSSILLSVTSFVKIILWEWMLQVEAKQVPFLWTLVAKQPSQIKKIFKKRKKWEDDKSWDVLHLEGSSSKMRIISIFRNGHGINVVYSRYSMNAIYQFYVCTVSLHFNLCEWCNSLISVHIYSKSKNSKKCDSEKLYHEMENSEGILIRD